MQTIWAWQELFSTASYRRKSRIRIGRVERKTEVGNRRVPHVRPSVRGTKTMGAARAVAFAELATKGLVAERFGAVP